MELGVNKLTPQSNSNWRTSACAGLDKDERAFYARPTAKGKHNSSQLIVLAPGEGRSYPMGKISSVFKSDGAETGGKCSISEWWIDAEKGSFIQIPAGMEHDFENRSAKKAGVLNLSIPGDFEKSMPAIADWFKNNPPGKTDGK